MKVLHPIAHKILARLTAVKGEPVSAADLSTLGGRAAIDQALSRLVRQGAIIRVGRGLYALPRVSSLLNQPMKASVDSLARAWARRNGLRIVPSGAHAANLLRLSTQVPARIIYYTNGRTQTVVLGSVPVRFLNRGPKTMDVSGKNAPYAFQALRWMGRRGMTPANITLLQSSLTPKDKSDLIRNIRYASAWMRPILEQIARRGDA